MTDIKLRLQRVHSLMKTRCYNPHDKRYKDRWWRWIKVCENWQSLKWFMDDMLPTYKEWLTIDRIDNNGDYCKENCRRATRTEQSRNRSDYNQNVEHNWEIRSIWERAEIIWMKYHTLYMRITKYHWTIKDAIESKTIEENIYEYNWEKNTLRQRSNKIGIRYHTLQWRIKKWRPLEKVFNTKIQGTWHLII